MFFFIDFDEKGVYDQSYSERNFFWLKPSKREFVILLKLWEIYILNPMYIIYK